ncbi:hypothetical protein [Saccharicrinis sp. FJH54]|uniref:MutS-related protein n=1 Tax=Saccharicrinis sp. FJH54 TaxID=3344665 RepID=UPI0035D4D298
MPFEIDRQTIRDLDIFTGDGGSKTIIDYFDSTVTPGGKKYLYNLMNNPVTDIQAIKKRTEAIQFFRNENTAVNLIPRQFYYIEYYLKLTRSVLHPNVLDAWYNKISYFIKPDNDYYLIKTGIENLIDLFVSLAKYITASAKQNPPEYIKSQLDYIQRFLDIPELKPIFSRKPVKVSAFRLNWLDHRFRKKYAEQVKKIIEILYAFDVFLALGNTSRINNLCIPEFVAVSTPVLRVENLFHPLVKNAVSYNVKIDQSANLCFLTGPNMAGKSTFLKSIGISVYLAHLGFPVPASKMQLTLFNGLITTINLTDNLNKGYSHFYSEVKRVKETALSLKEKSNLVVIFDELFRGTNVKDAYDASLFIITAFARARTSCFFISTHITEIADELKNIQNVQYKYLDSTLVDNRPVFNYKIFDGISHERLGMQIVKNEGIEEILNSI